jgi:bacillithiol system protein YtxJ
MKSVRSFATLLLAPLIGAVVRRVVPGAPAGTPANGDVQFTPVETAEALEDWFVRSEVQPVALFLHDPGCPISRAAFRQMSRLSTVIPVIPVIDVRTGTHLSHAVEERTGVRHESPQVIVLRHGQPVWSASHYAITAGDVSAALGKG